MILLLGFPKSGTSSFQTLFSKLGYKSFHWTKNNKYIGMIIKNNKDNNKPLLFGFNKNDCITQMDICWDENNAYWPQLTDYKQLYYENSDSVFILNKRCSNKLLLSFKRWGGPGKSNDSLYNRLYKYNPEIIINNSDKEFINYVNKHYNDVENFFSTSHAKFITFDIENDNIKILEKYIDLKGIKVLPKENVSK